MGKVRIVTDSTSDIPKQIADELGIIIVPLKVLFGEQTYLDGIEITTDEFYARLKQSSITPKTSQPSPQEFLQAYQDIIAEEKGDVSIISIHIATALSGTAQSANLAKNMLEGADITIVDSKSVSLGLGQMAIEMARLAKSKATLADCLKLGQYLIVQTAVYFTVDTLEYLQKGGRIGKAQALLGSLLNIRPILTFEEGVVSTVDKVRGQKKTIARITELIERFAGGAPIKLSIVHACLTNEEIENIRLQVNKNIKVKELLISPIGPVLGTYAGPRMFGVLAHRYED